MTTVSRVGKAWGLYCHVLLKHGGALHYKLAHNNGHNIEMTYCIGLAGSVTVGHLQ